MPQHYLPQPNGNPRYEMATAYKGSMRYLSLPKRVATELNLSSNVIKDYEYLEDLTQLWRRGIINPRETPGLG